MVDPQPIDFELNEETDEFHLILDGEDLGPVDMDDLREAASSLHIHFHMFRYAPEYESEKEMPVEDPEELTDEEVEAELEDLEDELSEVTDDEDDTNSQRLEVDWGDEDPNASE